VFSSLTIITGDPTIVDCEQESSPYFPCVNGFKFVSTRNAVLAYSWFEVRSLIVDSIARQQLYCSFSYIQYSAVCARTLRRCLKTSAAKEAMKREESFVRINKWQAGKLSEQVFPPSALISAICRSQQTRRFFLPISRSGTIDDVRWVIIILIIWTPVVFSSISLLFLVNIC
jgi:hypothetical protein